MSVKLPRVALVVGHSSRSPGAVHAKSRTSEFAFNSKVLARVKTMLDAGKRVDAFLFFREADRSNSAAYSRLPGRINAERPDLILEAHFNAAAFTARGTEMLYAAGSSNGERFARLLQTRVVAALGTRDRGVLPRTAKDRGGFLLVSTRAPAVIAEPFFGSNEDDWAKAQGAGAERLAEAYAGAIEAFFPR